jgi:hypothetical protein
MDAAIRDALRALAGGQLTVPIDSVLSLEQVNDAFGPISQCSARGKVGLDTTAWDACDPRAIRSGKREPGPKRQTWPVRERLEHPEWPALPA